MLNKTLYIDPACLIKTKQNALIPWAPKLFPALYQLQRLGYRFQALPTNITLPTTLWQELAEQDIPFIRAEGFPPAGLIIHQKHTPIPPTSNTLPYDEKKGGWTAIVQHLQNTQRHTEIARQSRETNVRAEIWLDQPGKISVATGIGFFDHMIEQIATHSGISLHLHASGDLHIDDHHLVEDCGLVLGTAFRQALGDKCGIGRFGFILPMDECLARCVLDLSGRPYCRYKARFQHQYIGELSTQMIGHFFYSLSTTLKATLHLKTKGENDHHKAESLFKAFGRAMRQAIRIEDTQLPSSKGIL
ncbi:imidazoleglycerol-phosphate dehydratase HisB [Bartonella sp. DGB2]|uniref:imidazoleglycerol-phosphate dehydratase HisB n=1 Tax=Bartonella sp. DGB2 TaxID=3388426 RepID=UPI00398F95DA